MKRIIFLPFLFVVFLSACTTTEYVTVERVRTDTLHHTTVKYDSIHVHDSIMIRQFVQGDTVHDVREVWHTQWRTKTVHDTVHHVSCDTIPVPVEVVKTVEVEKPLSWWQRSLMVAGGIALLFLLVSMLLRIGILFR